MTHYCFLAMFACFLGSASHPMSALGQKQTCAALKLMSAKCQKRTLIQQEARATTRASKNAEVWSGSAQVGWPNALVTPVLRGSTVASVTF